MGVVAAAVAAATVVLVSAAIVVDAATAVLVSAAIFVDGATVVVVSASAIFVAAAAVVVVNPRVTFCKYTGGTYYNLCSFLSFVA